MKLKCAESEANFNEQLVTQYIYAGIGPKLGFHLLNGFCRRKPPFVDVFFEVNFQYFESSKS